MKSASLSEYAMLYFQEGKVKSMKDMQNVRVVVRCRPMNDKEKGTDCRQVVKVSGTMLP